MKGKKTGGRKAGVPNKVTALAKDVISQVAANLGGAAGLQAWVRKDPKNEAVFWGQIYTKILPHDVKLSGDVEMVHKYEIPETRKIGQ